jgi:hypothetical protein
MANVGVVVVKAVQQNGRRTSLTMMQIATCVIPKASKHEQKANSRSIQGSIAQLGERLPCKQEVSGSIPLGSTSSKKRYVDAVLY